MGTNHSQNEGLIKKFRILECFLNDMYIIKFAIYFENLFSVDSETYCSAINNQFSCMIIGKFTKGS